jgi:RNA polymerase sigma-70 factor (ECF subfamily)
MNPMPVLSQAGIDPAALTDEALMYSMQNAMDQRIAEGLFSELFRRYEPRVRAWCLRMIGDPEQSIDLSQDIFLKAHRYMQSFRGDSRFSTWLYAIARNHCLNSIKKQAAEPVESDDTICAGMEDASLMDPYTAMERRQTVQLMWQLVSTTLTPLEMQVMTLHFAHEVPLAEITRQLALSNPSGAKAYIVSARRKLTAALRQNAATARFRPN